MVIDAVSSILEERRDALISDYARQILNDPHLEGLRKINHSELQGFAERVLVTLRDYLEGDDGGLERCLDFLGDACFQLSIPLLETAYALYILRDRIANRLAAEEIPEEAGRANQFFDRLVLALLNRY